MTVRAWKHLLAAACVVLALGLAATVAAFVTLPVEGEDSADSLRTRTAADRAKPPEVKPLAYYAVIHQRNLLKPIFDETAAAKAPPKLEVTLEGTALEPGFTYGMFRTKDGRVKFVSVGQTIEGAELLSVTSGQATLRYQGQEITLTAEKDKGGKR
jgi:hypothetical protein